MRPKRLAPAARVRRQYQCGNTPYSIIETDFFLFFRSVVIMGETINRGQNYNRLSVFFNNSNNFLCYKVGHFSLGVCGDWLEPAFSVCHFVGFIFQIWRWPCDTQTEPCRECKFNKSLLHVSPVCSCCCDSHGPWPKVLVHTRLWYHFGFHELQIVTAW